MKNRRTMAQFWLPIAMALSLIAPVALGQITIKSAVYGKNQTQAPGFVGASCYQRKPTILTSAVTSYCNEHSEGDICTYTVPWPALDQDPGIGCYKNFKATYTCSGFKYPRTIEFGGISDEAANQVALFNCAPMQIGSVTYTKDPSSQVFQSNGDVKTAGYSIEALNNGNAPYEGSINVGTRVSKASAWIQNLDKTKYYLNCDSATRVTTNSDGVGFLNVEYQVTGFSNVLYRTGNELESANVNFALKVNGSSCSGAFNYGASRQSPIEGNFFIVVNNTEVPLNIGFLAPQEVAADFRMVPMGNLLSASLFTSAITGNRKGLFQYDFLYRNKYGLLAGVGVTCTIGNVQLAPLSTDPVTGRLQLKGTISVTEAGRDDNNKMRWNVNTSLTGNTPAFTLVSGQNIGSVTCSPSDDKAAAYIQTLGDW